MIHLKREGAVGVIDGYTQEQRFFMSWATVWRNKIRDEELAMRLLTDPHSPGYFIAIGPFWFLVIPAAPKDRRYANLFRRTSRPAL